MVVNYLFGVPLFGVVSPGTSIIPLIVNTMLGVTGSFEMIVIVLLSFPFFPVESKFTLILEDSPGFKRVFSGFEAVQPHEALVFLIIKSLLPVFVNL